MFKKLLVVVISLSLIISAAEWQSLNGPATGLGEDISMGYDPNIPAWVIYSADAMYKLYKSVNEGEYWEPIQHQDINNPVCVITDPNNAQVVYIGKNADLPVWKSEDGGQTWEPKSYGITNTRPLCFAMDPTNSSIIYAGFDWDGGVHCLFKTTDAGVCWTDCNLAYSVRDIWIHPSNPEILYVATNSSVWKSTDGGCSWIELSTPSSSDVYCVAMVPEQNALFISIVEQNEPYNGSIYKTINDGAAWTRIFMSPEPPSYDLEILPTGLEIEKNTAGQIMYATYRPLGFYKSTDYGTSWVECNTGIGDKHLYSLMQHPNTPGCLFAGGCMAVYKSTDYGDSWIEITKGMRLAEVVKITEFDGTIWSGAYVPDYEYLYNDVPISGLVKSTNGGTYWKITHHANLHFIRDLEISASNPDIVFAVYQQEDRVGSYIFKTIDGGSNWVLKCYQGDYDIKDLTISNSTPDSVRACGHCFPPVWWYPKVWLTSDGGNNWQSFEFSSFLGRLYTIATDPMVSYTLYTSGRTEAGDISHGFEKSIDGSSDWGPVGSGCKKPIYKISIDPINTDIVYAAGDFGIFKSVNGANSFVGKSFGLSDSLTFDLTIDPEEPSIIYALVQEDTSSTTNSLYCTVDAAAKWFQFTLQPGNNPPEYIFDMCMDNVNFDKLYAGTERGAYAFYPQYINKHLVSSSYEATFANNGRKLLHVYSTDELWVTYESGGVIYAVHSTDAGVTWSRKMEIGEGKYPAVAIRDVPDYPPCIVWLKKNAQDTIYFAQYIGGEKWSAPVPIIVSSPSVDFGPPSFIIGSDNYGRVVYACHNNETNTDNIYYGEFSIYGPGLITPESVGVGINPCIGFMTPGNNNPEIHIVWQRNSGIYYRSRTLGGVWGNQEMVYTSGSHPFLEITGSVVYVVFAAGGDIKGKHTIYTQNGQHTWSNLWQVCATPNPSTYPVLTTGNACAWVEQIGDNKEVYFSYRTPETDWVSPINMSNSNATSHYPHICHKQTLERTVVYFIWTENDNMPYDIRFTSYSFGGSNPEPDLAFYITETGEEEPSPFNLHRGGYFQYGIEPYK